MDGKFGKVIVLKTDAPINDETVDEKSVTVTALANIPFNGISCINCIFTNAYQLSVYIQASGCGRQCTPLFDNLHYLHSGIAESMLKAWEGMALFKIVR